MDTTESIKREGEKSLRWLADQGLSSRGIEKITGIQFMKIHRVLKGTSSVSMEESAKFIEAKEIVSAIQREVLDIIMSWKDEPVVRAIFIGKYVEILRSNKLSLWEKRDRLMKAVLQDSS